jgi:hypothetical protein
MLRHSAHLGPPAAAAHSPAPESAGRARRPRRSEVMPETDAVSKTAAALTRPRPAPRCHRRFAWPRSSSAMPKIKAAYKIIIEY